MKINQQHFQSIWLKEDDPTCVQIIDQRHLPHQFIIEDLSSVEAVAQAIKEMHLRGAPLIGVTAAYGMYLACLEAPQGFLFDDYVEKAANHLKSTRPTAVNLAWAVDQLFETIKTTENRQEKIKLALQKAEQLKKESIERCFQIGQQGLPLIKNLSAQKNGEVINILTHCNAGWLACVDYGTATSPIYLAHDRGIKVHVWVDETRPRNQGARLTAYELGQHGIPHTVIPDNVGGHLMQHGMVDMVLVGTDRTTRKGDVANKIGTYLKALAAKDNNVPFYVALPSSTIDWSIEDGLKEIPIEKRGESEVKYIAGQHQNSIKQVLLTPSTSPAVNYAFDVTPAHLVTGLITEKGVCAASEEGLLELFGQNQQS